MTPERIEEIQKKYQVMDWYTLKNYVSELLDALEEAQQQLKEMTNNAVGWKEQYIAEWAKRSMLEREMKESQHQLTGKTEELETAYDALEKLQNEFNQLDKGAAEDYQKLGEAQQTIAAIQKRIDEQIGWTGEDGKELAGDIERIISGETQP